MVSRRFWVRTNLRTLVLTFTLQISVSVCQRPEESATAIGVLTEANAFTCAAAPVFDPLTFSVMPAPYGIPDLTAGMITWNIPQVSASVAIEGRGHAGWTELRLRARYRWSVDSAFSLGAATCFEGMWFRGFSPSFNMQVLLHALYRTNRWVFGVSANDVAGSGTQRPVFLCGLAYPIDVGHAAADIIVSQSAEPALLLTGRLHPAPNIPVTACLRTRPFSVSANVRFPATSSLDISTGICFIERLGITTSLAICVL